jgi:hypothetical protein
MPTDALFAQWETFYVIVGSSGGALTGLLFVVVALAADRNRSTSAPSIFHFCIVLFIAAMISMPRHGLTALDVALGGCALVGAVVTAMAVRRIVRFEQYAPVAEDWIWHAILPAVAYLALLVAALLLESATVTALYVIGVVTLTLLFVGIHNAWDAALYSAIYLPRDAEGSSQARS